MASLVSRRDHRCHLAESGPLDDQISRSKLDVIDISRLLNLGLLIEGRPRARAEPQILRQVEEEARLVSLL